MRLLTQLLFPAVSANCDSQLTWRCLNLPSFEASIRFSAVKKLQQNEEKIRLRRRMQVEYREEGIREKENKFTYLLIKCVTIRHKVHDLRAFESDWQPSDGRSMETGTRQEWG